MWHAVLVFGLRAVLVRGVQDPWYVLILRYKAVFVAVVFTRIFLSEVGIRLVKHGTRRTSQKKRELVKPPQKEW